MSQAKPITNNENLQAALDLAEAGFAVFPARAANKRPHVKDWQTIATTDPAQIRRWWKKWPDAMPAILTGRRNSVAVLDLDLKDGKDGGAALRALGLDPDTLSTCTVATPSGGRHLYFRWPEGLGCSPPDDESGKPLHGVDVRGQGGFVIAPGASHGRGRYRLLEGALAGDLPDWPDAPQHAARAPSEGSGEPTGLPRHVTREALMALPNDGDEYASRDAWLKIGMALHCETDGDEDGREAWHEWSGQWPGYDPGATDAAWDSFKPEGGVTGWTIITDAERHGWKNATVAELHRQFDLERMLALFTGPDEAELAEIEALAGVASDAPTADQAGGAASRLTFLTPADCDTLPARPYVIKGLLAQGDIAAIVGAPGAGKSLLAPRLGYAVAQGVEVFGRRTRQGGVFYVAVEDGHGMRGRLSALRQDHGEADAFHLVSGVSDLLSKKGELAELRAAVKARRPALVIIDTLAVAFPGLEENTAEGMGQVVAAARSLTKWGAAVILIHHDTKAGDGLPRGHSLLNGALDVSIALKRDGDVVACELSKNRNGPTALSIAFSIGTRNVGVDEDGDPITAAIAEEASGPVQTRESRLPASAAAALAVLRQLAEEGQPVSEDDWRDACVDGRKVSASEELKSRQVAFRRAAAMLGQRGLVDSSGGFYTVKATVLSLARSGTERFTDDMVEGDGE
jgi:KaiC/GvpD/RAD55 family RecA-like ATPase